MGKKLTNFCRWLVLGGALQACSTTSLGSKRKVSDIPVYRIFISTYDRVWDACTAVLDDYTIQTASRDSAYINTDYSEVPFNPNPLDLPQDAMPPERELKYRLRIKLSKAVVSGTQEPAVRVQITKEVLKYTNILTEWERIPSDLVEEKVLLYRIGKRLDIVESLRKKSVSAQ